MKIKISLFAFLFMMGIAFFASLSLPVSAAPAPQYTFFPTPTPGADGRIIYIVQEVDSIWRISAIFNIPLERLYEINKWGPDHIIRPGDEVYLGLGGPSVVTITPGPSPTPAPVTPTVTPEPGWGILCVVLYDDTNGTSTREEEEVALPGGAISVVERTGKDSRTAKSNEYDNASICNWDFDFGWALTTGFVLFSDLPEGEYNVSVAIPDGYNATTVTDRSFQLQAGSVNYLHFGAQANAQTAAAAPEILPTPETRSVSPWLLFGGILFLLGGLGLGAYAALLRKPG